MLLAPHGQPAGYAEAGNRHIVHIASPAMLFDRPLLVIERATVAMAPPANGRALSDIDIAAKLKDGSADLVVDDAKLLLDASGLHAARVASVPDAVASLLAAVTEMSFTTLAVHDAKLMYRATSATDGDLLGHLTCDISKPSAGHIQAKGTLTRGGISLPFDVTINMKAAKSVGARLPLNATITSDLLTAALTGDYLRDEGFKLSATSATISTPHAKQVIAMLAGTPVDGNGLEEFRAAGALEWSGATMNFAAATFTLDGNTAKGGLSLSVAGSRPLLDGTLAFDNLELTPYIRASTTSLQVLTQNALNWSRWLTGEPSSVSLIRTLDADLRVSATSVTYNGATLGRGAASLNVKDSKLLADLAEIELSAETQGNARITVDLSKDTPNYALRGMFEAPDLATVTQVFTDRMIVSGAGRTDIDVATSGLTSDELGKALTGSATLSMPDGGQVAVNLGSLFAAGRTGGLGWEQVAAGATTVNKLDAKLQAAGGVLTATDVAAETDTRSLQVGGTVDLSKQVVDLSIATAAKDGGVAAPSERVRIRGPILAPAIKSELPSKAALSLPN